MSLFDILEVSKLSQDKHTGMNMQEVSDDADTQSENYCRPPKWLSDVLPRTSRCTHIKVEVTAPAKERVAPIDGFINLSCSHIKKNRNRGLGKYNIFKCKNSS